MLLLPPGQPALPPPSLPIPPRPAPATHCHVARYRASRKALTPLSSCGPSFCAVSSIMSSVAASAPPRPSVLTPHTFPLAFTCTCKGAWWRC